MSGNGPKNRRKRARLFQLQGGLCYWCKKPMQLLNTCALQKRHWRPPPEMCTIDHLEPRWHPQRGQFESGYRLVASCLKCNYERDRIQQAALPRELLQAAAAGHSPRELARQHAEAIAHIFPVIEKVPRPRVLRFTFEPEPKPADPGPFKVALGRIGEMQQVTASREQNEA